MGGSVTIKAKRDQIAFTIAARVAAKLFVVDFKVGHGTADLAPPAVSPEYVLAELLVILLIEPDRRLFRHSSIHWIFSVTNCAKACLCSPGRNLKNRQARLQTGNLDATGELPANNNGHEPPKHRQEIAAESNGKRTVSSRKVEANRRNAEVDGTKNTHRQEESFEKCPPARVLLQMAAGPAPGCKRKPG